MTTGFKNMVAREAAAHESFITFAAQQAGLTREEAIKAFETLRKVRAIKIDVVTGTFHAKHGAFLEADVLRRAAQQ